MRQSHTNLVRLLAVVTVTMASVTFVGGSVSAAPSAGCHRVDGAAVSYRPPVSAPVVDGFRMTNGRYGAGNRGLAYLPDPSTPVRAVADGVVVFAGPVAGQLHVTLCHADGRRSSYSYLASTVVRTGQVVRVGATVGRSGEQLHVGVREGSNYIDPAPLFERGELRVRLVADAAFGRDEGRAGDAGIQLVTGTIDPAILHRSLRSTVGLGRLHG